MPISRYSTDLQECSRIYGGYHICEDCNIWNCGPLKERRVRADLIQVYKIIGLHRISAVSFDTFCKYNNYGATRGHLLKLASTELRHHFFSERVINIWNSLDNRTVTSGSRPRPINIFKGNLERHRHLEISNIGLLQQIYTILDLYVPFHDNQLC